MTDQDRSDEKKFKISDRRLFTEAGELREELPREPERPRDRAPEPPPQVSAKPPQSEGDHPKMEFASFLLSLAGSAMMHLGEGPPSGGAPARENLQAARQMIDILLLLKEKTQGNLTAEENQLLDQLLFELQMIYVQKTKPGR